MIVLCVRCNKHRRKLAKTRQRRIKASSTLNRLTHDVIRTERQLACRHWIAESQEVAP